MIHTHFFIFNAFQQRCSLVWDDKGECAIIDPGFYDSQERDQLFGYEQNIPQVYEILRKGSEVARAEAARTLADVRKAMRIDYFDDPELIREHTKKYSGQ